MRSRLAVLVLLAASAVARSAFPQAGEQSARASIVFEATGRIVPLPGAGGPKPCFISVDAWKPGSWNEPQYEVKELSPGSLYAVPAGTRVKTGEPDRSEAAQRDIERVVYALETALAFSDDMQTKVRDACQQLGSWINVRLVRDDPDVNGGMYRVDTNTLFMDLGDLDAERYVSVDTPKTEADVAERLAKSQNIRTTLAHEIDHMRGPSHDDPVPQQQHLFVGLPGIDESRVMEDLGFPLRRVAYGSSDGVPYEAFNTRVFLRSAPATVIAHGSGEAHRFETGAVELIDRLPGWPAPPRRPELPDSDGDGIPDVIDPCPALFSPTQRFGCETPDDARTRATMVAPVGLDRAFQWIPIWTQDSRLVRLTNARIAGLDSAVLPTVVSISPTGLTLPALRLLAADTFRQTQAALAPQSSAIRVPADPDRARWLQRFRESFGSQWTSRDGAQPRVPEPDVSMYFESTGQSSGDALRMTIINSGNVPFEFHSDGFVVEPVAGIGAADLDRVVRAVPEAARVTVTLKAYCLDRSKPVPPAGTVMRLAPAQRSLDEVRSILAAVPRLIDAGQLIPDVDRMLYLDSIRQWSVWSWEERFNQVSFERAFVEHTRKNVAAAGQRWQNSFDREARELADSRWRATERVLAEAGVRGSRP